MAKKRKYNLRLIKENYSYSVDQIADLLHIDKATVLRWIRSDGLARIAKVRPFLVHSKSLRTFLEKKQKDRKHPCSDTEIFCFKCQCPRIPKMRAGISIALPNGSIRFKAACVVCGTSIFKNLKATIWTKNHPLAAYLQDATQHHNGGDLSHHEYQLQEQPR